MNEESPFYRWPKGTFYRAQSELRVRVRQLWRTIISNRADRTAFEALWAMVTRRWTPVLYGIGALYIVVTVILVWRAFGP